MYDDDYDSRRDSKRLSYLPSPPMGESISTIPPSLAGAESPTSPQSLRVQNHLDAINNRRPNRYSRPSTESSTSTSSSPASPSRSSSDATAPFPLNDVNYESDPAAITQELSNLAAIRRMSMDVAATGDPDLPSYGSNFNMPSAPSPSADENDASRLFWVPARLHPELAPKEFKSFLESRADHIKRTSGDFSSLGPERAGSMGGLRRKKSMLSRQIDNSHDFTDGAERLERKRSQSRSAMGPNLHELETLVDDSDDSNKDPTPIVDGLHKLGLATDEDRPILPPAPPGASLRRSTRTQYKKGSFRKGEKLPYSRRVAKSSEGDETTPAAPGKQPILGLTRVSTDPTPSAKKTQNRSNSTRSTEAPSNSIPDTTFDTILDHPEAENQADSKTPESRKRVSPPQSRQWHSRISSNGRSTLNIPASEQKIPEIVETPPADANQAPSPTVQQNYPLEHEPRSDSRQPLTPKVPRQEQVVNKRPPLSRQPAKDSTPTLNEFANNPQLLTGNNMRTDSLSFIPTAPSEDRKPEPKKTKDKKETEGGRKSSWHWLLGTEDKDKDKDKKKESEPKKLKSKLVDKVHDNARLDILQSTDSQKGREGHSVDSKLEEERRKDSVRRASGETKKEKESGLFSSIFGGGRKKNSGDSHHKKTLSRNLSPDPPVRHLQPDVDYPWTRFSILEERAIYRMAHIKLANPRRALHSQVLLSNFMYSYLAKVQQMQPQMIASGGQRAAQPEEYLQYQRYQEVRRSLQFFCWEQILTVAGAGAAAVWR